MKPRVEDLPAFDAFFLTSKPKLQQLVHDIFTELQKYLLLKQNSELQDTPDQIAVLPVLFSCRENSAESLRDSKFLQMR